ncbi:MAG: pyridoxal phosphate-dependent aminotransferase, partial [Gemmataceae bacterium]
ENVLISNGAKHSIHNALAATVGPGDEVIIPTPYWVSYSDLVIMTGATAKLLHTTMDANFKLTAAELRAAIGPATRLIMLNSPSNPTGTVYTRAELLALAETILEYPNITILSDEIYELLTFGDAKPTCFVTLLPALRDRTITISGASKSYAMTGWRLGWTVAPAHVIKAMDNIQSQETSCPSSISQAAMITALDSPESVASVATMRAEFEKRRDLVVRLLRAMPGIKTPVPDGAFYAFFDISAFFGKTFGGVTVTNSMEFCTALLTQVQVNLVPGIAFGSEGFARMSFATSPATIEAGLSRMQQWLASGS